MLLFEAPIFPKKYHIQRRLLGCSTGLCSTIQIEQVMFDDPQKLGCSTRIMFDVEQQLSNKTLIEHNLFLDYVRLILISTFYFFRLG